MPKYCELFYSFFKIGTFTIGGGYAMLPLIERELVDRKKWMTREEYLDQMALAQSMPGILAVNMATGIGYKLRGVSGAATCIAGNIIMPIAMILILAIGFHQFKDIYWVEHAFMGIRPAVVALIAAPVFSLAKSARVSWANCWIPILSAVLIWLMGVSPIWVILIALLAGVCYGFVTERRKK